MRNAVILGSGCAGWTAALYLARANLKPLVLTGTQTGGLLTTTSIVENFPGFPQGVDGTALMSQMMEQAQKFGAEVEFGLTADEVIFGRPAHQIRAGKRLIETKTLIISTGAGHRSGDAHRVVREVHGDPGRAGGPEGRHGLLERPAAQLGAVEVLAGPDEVDELLHRRPLSRRPPPDRRGCPRCAGPSAMHPPRWRSGRGCRRPPRRTTGRRRRSGGS